MSKQLLKLLSERENFTRFNRYIKPHIFANDELKTIFADMSDWYGKDLSDSIDWNDFGVWFFTKNKLGEGQTQLFEILFAQLQAMAPPDDAVHKEIMHSFIIKDVGRQIGEIGLKAHDGDIDNLDEVYDVLAKYDADTTGVVDLTQHEVGHDLEELLGTVNVNGYNWEFNFFNEALGPVRQGDFVVIASRPDGGKTSLLCCIANGFAKQMPIGKSVIIFNNEGSGSKYRLRLIQTCLDMTYTEIRKDPATARRRYDAEIGSSEKIIIVDSAMISTGLVEKKLAQHDVGLIIFDQLYKVHGFEKAGSDLNRQAQLFQWARELAKKYAAVFTVHQADATAEGMEYIQMSQLYGSKTAIQGEADVIITIGKSRDPSKEYSRFFYIPKNKLIGGPSSNPRLRNGRCEMTIFPETGRFKE